MATKKKKQRTGQFNIGLSYYQERQWISAIKRYGNSILDKSLLSKEQKRVLKAKSKAGR